MTASIDQVFTTLFTAPTKAVNDAIREGQKNWIQHLQYIETLLNQTKKDSDSYTVSNLIELLSFAPTITLESYIETAITMKVASTSRSEGGIGAAIQLQALQVSGTFGFMSTNSQESTLQARAHYHIHSTRESKSLSLLAYLKEAAPTAFPDSPNTTGDDLIEYVKQAKEFLKKSESALSSSKVNDEDNPSSN